MGDLFEVPEVFHISFMPKKTHIHFCKDLKNTCSLMSLCFFWYISQITAFKTLHQSSIKHFIPNFWFLFQSQQHQHLSHLVSLLFGISMQLHMWKNITCNIIALCWQNIICCNLNGFVPPGYILLTRKQHGSELQHILQIYSC